MEFTHLRIFLAASVVFAHYYAITGKEGWWTGLFSSSIAVEAFFVISGWIVCSSYLKSSNVRSFLVRRIARLYPLYVLVVIVQFCTVFAITDPIRWNLKEASAYLAVNLLFANFLQPTFFGFLDGAIVQAIKSELVDSED